MKNLFSIIILAMSIFNVTGQSLDTISINVLCVDGLGNGPFPVSITGQQPTYGLYLCNSDSFFSAFLHQNLRVFSNQISTPYQNDSTYSIFNFPQPIYGHEVDSSGYGTNLRYYIDTIIEYSQPSICIVTDDIHTNSKVIVIDTSYLDIRDSLILERQVIGGWEAVDVNVQSTNIIDTTYPPGQAITYRLRSGRFQGFNNSPCVSYTVTTMNLSSSLSIDPNKVDLSWTPYAPSQDLDGYYVLRIDGSQVDTVAMVPIPSTTLTGVSWQAGQTFRIEAYKDACEIDPLGKSNRIAISSNVENPSAEIVDTTTSIINIEESIKVNIINPHSGLSLELSEPMDVKLYATDGRLIKNYSRTSRVNDNELANGLYFVVISDEKTVISRKLLVTE